MDKRLQKRWNREHRKKNSSSSPPPPPPGNPNGWVFHYADWGELQVSVMPRSVMGQVYDSNTGVVIKAPWYYGTLKAAVVVNDGNAVNCDLPPLNEIIWGNPSRAWNSTGFHAYTIPTLKVKESDRNDAWREAVASIVQGRKLTQEQAEAEAAQILGWCPYSVQCAVCHLLIPGFPQGILEQARVFGWKMWKDKKGFVCRTHSREDCLPLPTDEEYIAMGGE